MANKKKKKKLIYKPYYKGSLWTGKGMLLQAAKVFGYFLFFCIMYAIIGATLLFDSFILRFLANGTVLFICAAVIFNKGMAQGEEDVGMGEIVLSRMEEGKPVDPKEKKCSYRKARGWVVFFVAVIPVLLITIPAALSAERIMYVRQALPDWMASFENQEEIYQPLMHQNATDPRTFADVIRLLARILIMPYMGIFSTQNKDTVFLLERLAPVLAILPGMAYPIGYMMGPYARAKVHGNIALNRKRMKRNQKKAAEQRKQNHSTETKQNELI